MTLLPKTIFFNSISLSVEREKFRGSGGELGGWYGGRVGMKRKQTGAAMSGGMCDYRWEWEMGG